MKICINCGTELADNAAFCSFCGSVCETVKETTDEMTDSFYDNRVRMSDSESYFNQTIVLKDGVLPREKRDNTVLLSKHDDSFEVFSHMSQVMNAEHKPLDTAVTKTEKEQNKPVMNRHTLLQDEALKNNTKLVLAIRILSFIPAVAAIVSSILQFRYFSFSPLFLLVNFSFYLCMGLSFPFYWTFENSFTKSKPFTAALLCYVLFAVFAIVNIVSYMLTCFVFAPDLFRYTVLNIVSDVFALIAIAGGAVGLAFKNKGRAQIWILISVISLIIVQVIMFF